ncbi:PilZ domain-containing protein [Vibrio sinaloensis]|uniref:PilZ domain-containing protein n=1 Tax=Vibrio TaxID=662 RepID=UPI0022B035B1|nr:PilZ domain-containing protein [Vibrio sinaloensis]MCZ4292835.1 PilZ domain-containing protein [Vibrio sinaloensis]
MAKAEETAESIELSAKNENIEKAQEPSSSIRYGEDAFQDVMPLCEVACIVTTPTGKVLKCRTKYIGLHSNNILLMEMPDISAKEMSLFMQRGYSIKACVISSKGEGARVYFKSKIEYVLSGGDNDLLLITLPKATQVVVGLRESARLEISLDGILAPDSHKYICQIRDISQHGCLIVVDRGKTNYNVGSGIELKVFSGSDGNEQDSEVLRAVVKNVTKTSHYRKYGVKFDDDSLEFVSSFIEGLNFCSIQQKFTL